MRQRMLLGQPHSERSPGNRQSLSLSDSVSHALSHTSTHAISISDTEHISDCGANVCADARAVSIANE